MVINNPYASTIPDFRDNPFRIKIPIKAPILKRYAPLAEDITERLISFRSLQEWYLQISSRSDNRHFFGKLLDLYSISYMLSEKDLSQIPKSSAVVVLANHPFGAIEGILLATILRSVRPDAKIMANYLLGRIKEIHDFFFFVDPFQKNGSASINKKSLRKMMQFLRQGGMLGIFPAGEVAHFDMRDLSIKESKWKEQIVRIIRKTKSSVLPVYFEGTNSLLFHLLGLIHPFLRTAMIPRELVNKRGKSIEVKIGSLISFSKLEAFKSDAEMMDYLNCRTLMLKNRGIAPKASIRFTRNKKFPLAEIGPSLSKDLLIKDIYNLPPDQALLEGKDYAVFYAKMEQAPTLLQEIGRLREITFREIGEGSGNSADLDLFDKHYLHLFVWNKQKREVIGAFRLGQTDEILKKFGKEGLYTTTLFNFQAALFKQINPALEMGRAFVRAEYRKTSIPIYLLWKGIAQYLSRNPRYKLLFGPVSISNEYRSISKRLLVEFLKKHKFNEILAKLVRAKIPFHSRGAKTEAIIRMIKDVDEISEIISDLEFDRKGIPPIMKFYLNMGGKCLGFNLDPKFGNVLDCLVLIDLTQGNRKMMEYYMGREELANFLASASPGQYR